MAVQFLEIDFGMKELLPYQPWAKDLKQVPRVMTNGVAIIRMRIASRLGWCNCILASVSAQGIIQTLGMVVILYEKDGVFWQIFTDGGCCQRIRFRGFMVTQAEAGGRYVGGRDESD